MSTMRVVRATFHSDKDEAVTIYAPAMDLWQCLVNLRRQNDDAFTPVAVLEAVVAHCTNTTFYDASQFIATLIASILGTWTEQDLLTCEWRAIVQESLNEYLWVMVRVSLLVELARSPTPPQAVREQVERTARDNTRSRWDHRKRRLAAERKAHQVSLFDNPPVDNWPSMKEERQPTVVLRGPTKPPVVCGVEQETLTQPRYNVVSALLEAGERGLTKDALVERSGHTDARHVLGRIRRISVEWENAIILAGRTGGRYRVRFEPPKDNPHLSPPFPT